MHILNDTALESNKYMKIKGDEGYERRGTKSLFYAVSS
jgi:hypothetical protein